MTRVGVVGAGAAAAAATYVLDGATDAEVTVVEKSRGLCGRAATRRRGDVTYDYGANYVKSDDPRVNELLTGTLDDGGLVDVTDPVHVFDADGEVSPGREADEHKWTYREGLTQIAKRLFGGTDATVHRETRVEGIRRESGDGAAGEGSTEAGPGEGDGNGHGAGSWRLVDADGTEWGPFDALALNPPAPQTAALLRSTDWDHPLRDDLVEAVGDVEYRSIWTAVLHYPFELDRPYYALVNPGKDHDVGWISREECKPGHVPDGESLLIVQAAPEWSAARYDDPPAENVADLAAMTAEILDDPRITDPDWTDHQGWRYALPDEGVDRGVVDSAREHGLYCVGDWVAGEARVHAALRNGLETGERMAYRI